MPNFQPSVNDVHVDRLLTNFSIAYRNPQYVADKFFPLVTVNRQSDVYASYDQSPWFRDEARLRAPGTKAQESGYTVSTSNQYMCLEKALAKTIPDEVRANADAPFNLDRETTEFLTDKIQLSREASFVSDFFTTSVWGTDKTGGTDFTVWSNYAGSNPIVDNDSFRETVLGKIGREPNKAVFGTQVITQLKNHPDILDLIKYTERGVVTEQLIASLFGLDELLIGKSIQTTDKEGTAEASVSYSFVWGKNGLYAYIPPNPGLMTPSAGITFTWNVFGGINYTKRFRLDEEGADKIQVGSYFDQKLTSSNAGLFVSGAIA